MDDIGFSELDLSGSVVQDLQYHGFETMLPIQHESIPVLLDGRDLIAQAKTGTGKTFAFAVPIVEKIVETDKSVQALVVTPTRELAIQVAGEIKKIAYRKRIKVACVYGGKSVSSQAKVVRDGAHTVVGTPGRLLDLIGRGILSLNKTRMLVLDEADRMLDMGFIDDIRKIISHTPSDRQTMLFSATIPDSVRTLAREITKNPVDISTGADDLMVDDIDQCYYEIPQREKLDVFEKVVRRENPRKAIIFCNTKRWADKLTKLLSRRGLDARVLHGDMNQSQREKVTHRFRKNDFKFLVATDVAARGLDIEDVSHIFNYDLPKDPDSYVHRIGRTGRCGKIGKAVSFINPQEIRELWGIEHRCQTKITEESL